MEPAPEGASVTAVTVLAADSTVELAEAEGGVGVAGENDAAARGAEAVGDSEEDGEDVFEVEKILDMKTEGGKVLYKVRWKGYTSDDDTWEPEIHLEDCKEVLLEFRKKVAENKAKAVRKDIQKLFLNNDIFEANSDSDQQSETKEDTSPKKKKKKLRQREEKSPDDLKKKKTKAGKLKDKSKPDLESSLESLVFDLRTKKRISEAREDLKESKKPQKDEVKETKELKKIKKGEIRDLKTKTRDDPKENRKTKKEKWVESQVESESSVLNDLPFTEDDSEGLLSESREERQKTKSARERAGQEARLERSFEKPLDGALSAEEDTDVRGRRKKKTPRKSENTRESRKLENKNTFLEKKTVPKKQRNQDRGKSATELEKLTSVCCSNSKGLEIERGRQKPPVH
ncbi:M-phase phosphoprotein 8 [Plecturocebus cupreus]